MENNLATILGLGLSTVSTFISSYTAFKKTNVEIFFSKILDSEIDLKLIGADENLQRKFFSIVETVSNESNVEKIENWKNVIIHLATDFYQFDYCENFMEILKNLTVFDLMVLHKIYTKEFKNPHFELELINSLKLEKINENYSMLAIKRLAAHNLVDENYDARAVLGGDDPILDNMYYKKNVIGKEFLDFISINFEKKFN